MFQEFKLPSFATLQGKEAGEEKSIKFLSARFTLGKSSELKFKQMYIDCTNYITTINCPLIEGLNE